MLFQVYTDVLEQTVYIFYVCSSLNPHLLQEHELNGRATKSLKYCMQYQEESLEKNVLRA